MSRVGRDTLVETRTVDTAVAALPAGALATWLRAQRWYGGKSRAPGALAVEDVFTLEQGPPAMALVVLRVEDASAAAAAERYVAVLGVEASEGAVDERSADAPALAGASVIGTGGGFTVYDATEHPRLPGALATLCGLGARWPGARGGKLTGRATAAYAPTFAGSPPAKLAPRRIAGEQSNTSFTLGERVLVKLLRRLEPGPHPEAEVTDFLAQAGFTDAPGLVGALMFDPPGADASSAATIALLETFVPDARDAWSATLDAVRGALARGDDPAGAAEPLAALGGVTAAMHLALATGTTPEFAPVPFADDDRAALARAIARRVEALADARAEGDLAAALDRVRAALPAIEAAAGALPDGLLKTRVHGDYHLGQVLARGDAAGGRYVIIDFEGEPARPLAERRATASPLRDVAGMLRSFSYAAHTLAREDASRAGAARAWERAAREAFVRGYQARIAAAGDDARARGLWPAEPEARARALALFELDKALYEVRYELDHRPDWVAIPVAGVTQSLALLGL